jgi:hypothetical protein
MSDYTKVHTVNNILEANDTIMELERDGYKQENIFVLTHDKKRTDHIADNTDANKIGISEEGIMTAVSNIFRSTGDGLRAKMTAMGVAKDKAAHLEKELDNGKIVILAWTGKEYDEDHYDEDISYTPSYDKTPIL